MTGGLLCAMTVLGVPAVYAFACWRWPFAKCPKCEGKGRRDSPTGRAFRLCKRCKGSGRRIRTGRRVFNWLRLLRDESR